MHVAMLERMHGVVVQKIWGQGRGKGGPRSPRGTFFGEMGCVTAQRLRDFHTYL